jgi:hypothetical protein
MPLRKALLASATRKLHLGVVGAGVAAALVASAMDWGGQLLPTLTLGLGLLTYAALVALDVTNPDYIRRVNSRLRVDDQDAEAWLDPKTLRDAEIREVYAGILSDLDRCRAIFASTSPTLRSSLKDGMDRSEELVRVAGRAAKRSNTGCARWPSEPKIALRARASCRPPTRNPKSSRPTISCRGCAIASTRN